MQLAQEFDAFIKGKHPLLKWRPQQKEAVLDIIRAYNEDPNGIYLLDAPTGSGKSVIAMIFADFLVHKENKGYILASDLTLHAQYAQDFRRMQLWNWGNVKGVDNYLCVVNNEKFSIGDCKNKGTSYDAAESLSCFKDCGYLKARKKAMRSPVSLLTYPYALIQRNYVDSESNSEKGKSAPFPARDFVIADEAHKLLNIVQSHFSPIVSHDITKKCAILIESLRGIGVKPPDIEITSLDKVIKGIYHYDDQAILLRLLQRLTTLLEIIVISTQNIREIASIEFLDQSLPFEWISVFGQCDWFKDVHCKIQDYCEIIKTTSTEKLIKNPGEDNIVFNCIDEYYLLKKHFFDQFGFKLLMTATMGDPSDFMKNHGIRSAQYFKIESHFDWTKSPIIFYPGKKMSAGFLDQNIYWAIDKIERILDTHQGESGIIHSGSYELNNRIWRGLSKEHQKRIVLYKGTEEKDLGLKRMAKKKGLVLMGPSILEGLNMIDEKSRFQIFLKVPYPYLGDKFVAAKLKYQPEWYDWQTCNHVLQGIGRSVRSDTDWAVTYLLDGCFANLFNRSKRNFPPEFHSRLQIKYG